MALSRWEKDPELERENVKERMFYVCVSTPIKKYSIM